MSVLSSLRIQFRMRCKSVIACLSILGIGTTNYRLEAQVTSHPSNRRQPIQVFTSPAECFTCETSLRPWLLRAARNPELVVMVATRAPTDAEKQGLVRARVKLSALENAERWTKEVGNKRPFVVIADRGHVVAVRAITDPSLKFVFDSISGAWQAFKKH